jgi:hypothetical protein
VNRKAGALDPGLATLIGLGSTSHVADDAS